MIVPKFRLQQDDLFVYVTIVVPYIRVGSAELAVTEACRFSFYCSPYLLKLSFSCPIRNSDDTDDGNCKATYDPSKDHGTIVAKLPKLNRGQWFPDLDLTTKLLQIGTGVLKAHPNVGPASIEVMGEISGSQMHCFELEDSSSSCLIAPKNRYGFLSRYSGVFVDLREELQDMLEVKDPESMTASDRRRCRVSVEDMLFDAGRYLADQLEGEADPIFKDAMSLQPFFVVQWDHRTRLKSATSASTTVTDIAGKVRSIVAIDASY